METTATTQGDTEKAIILPLQLLQAAQRIAMQEHWAMGDAVQFLAKYASGAVSEEEPAFVWR